MLSPKTLGTDLGTGQVTGGGSPYDLRQVKQGYLQGRSTPRRLRGQMQTKLC